MSWDQHPPVVGMDTSSFGFHIVSSVPIFMPGSEDAAVGEELSNTGWVVTGAKDSYDRLRLIHSMALRWFAQLPRGTSVWCEEALVLPKNPETTRKLVMVTGVLYAAFMEARPDATWFFVNVSSWRRDVLNPPKGESPKNKDGWKALARRHVHGQRFPETALGATLEGYELRSEAESVRRSEIELWDSEPDLYDAACLMEYGMQQLSKGTAALR